MTQTQVLNANFDWLQAGKKEVFPEYKIDNQKTVFDRIAKAKRSTFDRSKFTIVGSPTITDGGVASGFSSTNYLTSSLPQIDISNKIVKIFAENEYTQNPQEYAIIYEILTDNGYCTLRRDSGANVINGSLNGNYSGAVNASQGKFKFITTITNGLNFSCDVYKDNTFLKTLTGAFKTQLKNLQTLNIGRYGVTAYQTIDLSQFSIEVDGIEIFNGNKTGVDQIKKDNFTKVDSPAITADGIMTNNFASNTNYISMPFNLVGDWRVGFQWKTPVELTGSYILTSWNASFVRLTVNNDYKQLSCSLFMSDGTTLNLGNIGNVINKANTVYDIYLEHKDTTYSFGIKEKGTSTYRNLSATSALEVNNNPFIIFANADVTDKGSIDLNTFKIYNKDKLTSQATLRIPYTQSKTGCKIVDSIYRVRVQDMYEQFGYTHYYTIGDDDYTLQTVPNEQIVDSYYADNSFMELTADLLLTQGGGAVSGQTVNLKRPYKDNKYIATIGTSSKATNSFVASASGQWITKGKGVLG